MKAYSKKTIQLQMLLLIFVSSLLLANLAFAEVITYKITGNVAKVYDANGILVGENEDFILTVTVDPNKNVVKYGIRHMYS